jgi:hypothetical protein
MTSPRWRSKPVMNKFLILTAIYVLQFNALAQFSEPEFFNRVNTTYYALELTDLNNFSSWVSSNIFEETAKDLYKDEIYPIEFLWVKPNDPYFIRRPLPPIQESLAEEKVQSAQNELQQELRALIMDWGRFYAGRLLADMPSDYTLETRADTVLLNFKNYKDPRDSETHILFGPNGLVLQTSVVYRDSSERINTFPEYKYTGEYWLCTGWRVQILKKDEVISGFRVKVISKRIEKYWLPSQFQMELQSKDIQDKIFIRVYNFRNIRINRDIQVINRGT